MSNLVTYSNDFNFMPFPKMTELEMNIFMNIICNIKQNREFSCSFFEFYSKISDKQNKAQKEIINYFEEFAEKLLRYAIKFSVKDRFYSFFVCFEKIKLIKKENNTYTLIVKIQEDFYNLIINQQLGFTKFELCEFVTITGKYAKSLYRLLKQFRNTGKVFCFTQDWQKFCELIQIPETYTRQADIDKSILNPAIKELSKYFKNLRYQKIKDTKSKGNKVIGIEFFFKAEKEPIEVKEEVTKPKTKAKPKKPYILQYFDSEEEQKERLEDLIQQKQQGAKVGTIIVK